MHLLDVNILIALGDRQHPHFQICEAWFKTNASSGWATCPITENGFLRILGHPSYAAGPGSPEAAATILRGMMQVPGHCFLADDFSLPDVLPTLKGASSGQLTDLYLLAMAVRNGARFLTLDQRIDPRLVPGGVGAYVQLAP